MALWTVSFGFERSVSDKSVLWRVSHNIHSCDLKRRAMYDRVGVRKSVLLRMDAGYVSACVAKCIFVRPPETERG